MNQKEKKSAILNKVVHEVLSPMAILEEMTYGSLAGVAICMGGHPFE